MCGGTAHTPWVVPAPKGLSPRVRGNLGVGNVPAVFLWSIPACAGEPAQSGRGATGSRVYPRVCGGTNWDIGLCADGRGLSPRVRGNLGPVSGIAVADRSIPACAGEPPPDETPQATTKVYPRVCGGTSSVSAEMRTSKGLSPRVRGNRPGPVCGASGGGSIPACAGEPGAAGFPAGLSWVYPRVCGGTEAHQDGLADSGGLSPRVRGNPSFGVRRAQKQRSIPACAGEPRPTRMGLPTAAVYPRVCGGTHHSEFGGHKSNGLSPRVRGNPVVQDAVGIAGRSIPACAGEPQPAPGSSPLPQVYPRVCGGTRVIIPAVQPFMGLSPRVRGNLPGGAVDCPVAGSIPACAGEPPVGC